MIQESTEVKAKIAPLPLPIRKICLPLLVSAFLLGAQSGSTLADSSKIRIGVSAALTGNAASFGTDIKNALAFANVALAGGAYELVIEDDKCSSREAVSIAHKFINQQKIKYVLGLACSNVVLATAPLYEAARVIVISPSAASSEISQAGDYIFRTWPSVSLAARLLYDDIRKYPKAGVLSEETDFAQTFLKDLQRLNNPEKTQLYNENYLTEQTDLRTALLRLKNKGISALFINSQTEITFLAALRQARELALPVQVYSIFWPGSSAFLKEAKDLANGIRYVDAPLGEAVFTLKGKRLMQEFRSQYGAPLYTELQVALAFEALRALHQAIQSGGNAKTYLYNTRFEGLFGPWRFDRNGDIVGLDYQLYVIEKGRPEPVRKKRP